MGGMGTYTKRLVRLIWMALLLPCQITADAQVTLPDIPDIIRVTVDPADGGYLIQWEPSSDPDVISYHIYSRNNLVFQLEATVPADTHEYKYPGGGLKNLAFSVTAVDAAGNESLFEDNVHRAALASVVFDPCIPGNVITWAPYEGWDGNISAYQIYGRPAGGSFTMLDFVSPATLTYTDESITVGNDYLYYIVAVHTSGITSLSGIEQVSSLYPEPPGSITVDFVSVTGPSEVEIGFTTEPYGEVNDFRVMKRSQPGTPYIEVTTLMNVSQGTVKVTDQFPTAANQYEYMVQSLYLPPSCSRPIILSESNTGTSILLGYEVDGQTISLHWTPYLQYADGLAGYIIQRGGENGEYIDIQRLGPGTEQWEETLISEVDGFQTGELRYRVVAESSAGSPGLSASNEVQIHVETHLRVPNAFTPGSNDMNFEFKPMIDFAPRDYVMMIMDRGGRKLFETRDPGEGWEGRFRQGEFVPEGVYVYHIQFTDYTGLFRTFTGNVTVLYP
jgi:gliding motility-associated-like protein